jgi:hypothetical protein
MFCISNFVYINKLAISSFISIILLLNFKKRSKPCIDIPYKYECDICYDLIWSMKCKVCNFYCCNVCESKILRKCPQCRNIGSYSKEIILTVPQKGIGIDTVMGSRIHHSYDIIGPLNFVNVVTPWGIVTVPPGHYLNPL